MVHYLTFDEVGITIAVIGIALAFLVLVWNAVKAIHDWRQLARRPTVDTLADHGARIHKLEERAEEVDRKLDGDWKFRQSAMEMDRLTLSAIRCLLRHGIDGNDVGKLKKMDEEIDNYLVKHMN